MRLVSVGPADDGKQTVAALAIERRGRQAHVEGAEPKESSPISASVLQRRRIAALGCNQNNRERPVLTIPSRHNPDRT